MQKNDLLKSGDSILRILEIREDGVLTVECVRKVMPKWLTKAEIAVYTDCTEQEMLTAIGKGVRDYENLDRESRRFAHEHFTRIAGILPFVGDEKKRSAMIASAADNYQVSKQTIRNHCRIGYNNCKPSCIPS